MANQNSINNTSYGLTVIGTALINQSGSAASTIGSSSAGALALASGSASTLTISNASFTAVTGTGSFNISNDATANSVNIATGAGIKALTLGSTNSSSSVTINVGSGGLNVPSFTNTGAVVTDASGLITDASASTAGYVLTSNGSGSAPSFQVIGSSFTWNDVTGTTQAMAVANGYVSDNASLVTMTLPSTAAFGTVISVSGAGAGGWLIAQNASQLIHFGNVVTTTGTGGSLASTNQYDSLDLLCVVANTTWTVRNAVGNITYA